MVCVGKNGITKHHYLHLALIMIPLTYDSHLVDFAYINSLSLLRFRVNGKIKVQNYIKFGTIIVELQCYIINFITCVGGGRIRFGFEFHSPLSTVES